MRRLIVFVVAIGLMASAQSGYGSGYARAQPASIGPPPPATGQAAPPPGFAFPARDSVWAISPPGLPTADCYWIRVGCQVRVINFQQVNVRVTPGYVGKPAWDAVATVPSGAILWVAAGPDVADGLTWWWVSFGPIQGWVAAFANTGTQILDPVLRGGYITGPGVPTCAIGQPHTVGYGQYLVHLSNFYGVTVTSIMRTNGLRSIDLWPGQVLCIPVPGSGVSPVESVVGEVGYWQPSAVGLGVGSGTLLMQRAEAGVQWIDWTPYTTFSYATGPAATPGVLMAGNQIEVIGEHGLPGRLLARHVVVLKPALP